MAAAFGLPVVVVFGASDPAIWGPWRTQSEIVQPARMNSPDPGPVLRALTRLRVTA